MTTLQAIIKHGSAAPLLLEKNIRQQRDGLDGGTLKYLTPGEFDFRPGVPPPGYPGLEIDDVSTDTEGEDYIHTLSCFGILGPRTSRREKGFPKRRKTLEGWDEASDSWIVKSSALDDFEPGSAMVGNPTMFCVEAPDEPLHGGYYRITPTYRGLLWSKPVKRVITSNGQVVSPSVPIVVDLPGGWEDPRNAQVSLPRVVCTDSYVTNSAAPTDAIPGNATPVNAPDVQVISVFGAEVVYQWPYGWRLESVSSDELGETGYRLLTLVYEYQYQKTF
jgi:hypothetical protein